MKNLPPDLYTIYPNNPNDPDGIRQYFQRIIDAMPNNVYWLNRDCVTLGCNRNTLNLVGLNKLEEFVGITYEEMGKLANWTEGQAQSFKRDDMETMASGKPKYNVEEPPLYDKHGNPMYYMSSRVPLFDDQNTVIGVIGISVDITERKKSEIELFNAKALAEAASQAKTEFLENMRHDIRTPLTGIVGFADLIRKESDIGKIREYSDSLIASSNTLLDLLNEVLEATYIASGDMPIVERKFNLHELMDKLIELNNPASIEKNINLVLNFDKNIPNYVISDPKRIFRIVQELTANALKFTKKGNIDIKVMLSKKENREIVIKVLVIDTGIGMSDKHQQDIFMQFKKINPSYQGIYTGSGLGLWMVKQYLNDLGGEIYVESKPGKGSLFTCILPLTEALLDEKDGAIHFDEVYIPYNSHNTIKRVATKSSAMNAHSGQLNILVVEDNDLAAIIAAKTLNSLNCNVDVAVNGKAAYEMLQKQSYDLIFMDIGLPDISGIEVTKNLRAAEVQTRSAIPIIGLTAHIDKEKKLKCIAAGMNAVLSKPMSEQTAKEIIQAFVPEIKPRGVKPTNLIGIDGEVIDLVLGAKLIGGDTNLAKEAIEMLIDTCFADLKRLEEDYKQHDWNHFEYLIHKIRSGICYCGVPRFQEACMRLENYLLSGEREFIVSLYEQVIVEFDKIKEVFYREQNSRR